MYRNRTGKVNTVLKIYLTLVLRLQEADKQWSSHLIPYMHLIVDSFISMMDLCMYYFKTTKDNALKYGDSIELEINHDVSLPNWYSKINQDAQYHQSVPRH